MSTLIPTAVKQDRHVFSRSSKSFLPLIPTSSVILADKYVAYDLESEQIAPTVYGPGDVSRRAKGQAAGLEI